jgi:hypothetical protein
MVTETETIVLFSGKNNEWKKWKNGKKNFFGGNLLIFSEYLILFIEFLSPKGVLF